MAIPAPIQQFTPKIRNIPIVSSAERILQSGTDFIRGNPLVSTASVGAGVTALVATAAVIKKRKKTTKKKKATKKRTAKKRKTTRKKTTKRKKKKTKAELRRIRLKNLAKARRARKMGAGKRRKKKAIIRGRGIGRREIKHSGKSTRGKMKVVSFRTKQGKLVRFKVRRR